MLQKVIASIFFSQKPSTTIYEMLSGLEAISRHISH